MKTALTIIVIILIGFIGVQVFKLYNQNIELDETASKINIEMNSLAKENSMLESDLNYFSNPENLEKELRSRLNYKEPNEKLIIVIPPKDQSQ